MPSIGEVDSVGESRGDGEAVWEELTELDRVGGPVMVPAADVVEVAERVERVERVARGEGEVEEVVDTVRVPAEELDAPPVPVGVGDRVSNSGVCVVVVEGEPLSVPSSGEAVFETVKALGVRDGVPVPNPSPGVPVATHTVTVPKLVGEGGPGVTVKESCPESVPVCEGVEALPAVREANKGVFDAAFDREGGEERVKEGSAEREGVVLMEELTLTLGDTAPVPVPPAPP